MRAVWQPLAGLGAAALWGASLWWGLPWAVDLTVRPARPAVSAPAPGWRVLQATVTRTYPGLTGLALGDAVQFDRYGVLPPTEGSTQCLWLLPWSLEVTITPLGGRVRHAGAVRLDPALPSRCPESAPDRAVVSGHP